MAITRIKPKTIINEEDIRTNHLVIGSKTISIIERANILFFCLVVCLIDTYIMHL